MAPGKAPKALLSGIRVLDLGQYVAGPLVGSLLADFGAEVIKVESPRTGDFIRHGPYQKNGESLWWKVSGRNKKSVTLDLRLEKGQELFRRLAAETDVLIESFRPGKLESWSIGWDVLHGKNPRLIMLRISAYGQSGPYRDRPGFGKAAGEAMSGIAHLTGNRDGPPMLAGFSHGDTVAGLMGLSGVLMALYYRDAAGTGVGQYIDLALFEPFFRLIEWQIIAYDQLGVTPTRNGNRMPYHDNGESNSIAEVFQSQDGRWLTLSAANFKIIRNALGVIGGRQVQTDPRFSTIEALRKHRGELYDLIGQWMRQHTADHIVRLFDQARAVISPVYSARDLINDPQVLHRGDIVQVADTELGTIRMQGVVPKFSATPGEIKWPGPHLGQHNQEIYGGLLGLSEETQREYAAQGVI